MHVRWNPAVSSVRDNETVEYHRSDTGEHAENPAFIGHIYTAKTARLIAKSGHVKAQYGKTHKTARSLLFCRFQVPYFDFERD
jgi:hypothetical protein